MAAFFLFAAIAQIWYSVPLVVSVSLVYAATRHEAMQPILVHAARTAAWIAGFMVLVFVVQRVATWGL